MTSTNHFRPRWLIAALLVLMMPSISALAADPSSPTDYIKNPQQWPKHCTKMKAELSESPVNFLTFTPLPNLSPNIAAAWKLEWDELAVPVPALQYTKITLIDNDNALGFATDDHQSILVIGFSSPQNQTPRQNPARKSRTEKTRSQLGNILAPFIRAFTITPNVLTCSTENVKQQILDTFALQQKRFLPGLAHSLYVHKAHIIAAHKVEGSSAGLLTYARTSSKDAIYLYLLQNKLDSTTYGVIYQFSGSRSDLFSSALLLAKPKAAIYTDSPFWFQQLQAWLDKPTQTHWCTLLGALKHAYFDPENLQHLAKQHPACQAP